jgi:hypothetical protein
MSVVAAVRPDEWNLPLLVHVLGAMILVGGLVTASSLLGLARRDERMLRYGYWSLLTIALPGWIAMRVGAQWIYSEEGWDDLPDGVEPEWLDIGFVAADVGGLVLLVSVIVGGIGAVRLRRGDGAGSFKVTMVLSLVLLVAYLVAAWAMAAKPM